MGVGGMGASKFEKWFRGKILKNASTGWQKFSEESKF
jgi:hypothetical protein